MHVKLNCPGQICPRRTVSVHPGEMAEWLKAHAWKACLGETLTWVRIPLSPPVFQLLTDRTIRFTIRDPTRVVIRRASRICLRIRLTQPREPPWDTCPGSRSPRPSFVH